MNENRREATATEQLEAVIRLLALPAAEALERAGLASPDALAIDFDEAYTGYVGTLDELPTERQLAALQELDAQLQTMADPALRSLWTAEAMVREPAWATVRARAHAVLIAFEWSAASAT